jgi:hypothetical protein
MLKAIAEEVALLNLLDSDYHCFAFRYGLTSQEMPLELRRLALGSFYPTTKRLHRR